MYKKVLSVGLMSGYYDNEEDLQIDFNLLKPYFYSNEFTFDTESVKGLTVDDLRVGFSVSNKADFAITLTEEGNMGSLEPRPIPNSVNRREYFLKNRERFNIVMDLHILQLGSDTKYNASSEYIKANVNFRIFKICPNVIAGLDNVTEIGKTSFKHLTYKLKKCEYGNVLIESSDDNDLIFYYNTEYDDIYKVLDNYYVVPDVYLDKIRSIKRTDSGLDFFIEGSESNTPYNEVYLPYETFKKYLI